MQTYLSIDLDFWNQGKHSFLHMKNFLRRAKETVAKKNLVIVDSHEELLPYVNSSGCDTLINVDWHSDVSNRFDSLEPSESWMSLNCGTWITYVDFREEGLYTWIHPYKASEHSKRGYCHYPYTRKHNPFVYPQLSGWDAIKERKNKHPEKIIDFSFVSHIGISFSYDWVKFNKIWDIAQEVLEFRPEKNIHAILS